MEAALNAQAEGINFALRASWFVAQEPCSDGSIPVTLPAPLPPLEQLDHHHPGSDGPNEQDEMGIGIGVLSLHLLRPICPKPNHDETRQEAEQVDQERSTG